LFLDNTIVGDDHLNENARPFEIGKVEPHKGYVHVLDDITLDVVLGRLDTVTDFVDYLSKKEEFLTRKDFSVFVAGEEDLLAYYSENLDNEGRHNFILPKENLNFISLEEGFWEEFVKSPEFRAQAEADKISYSWDRLIETFNTNILRGSQHYSYPDRVENQEKIVRFLAREPRIRRRISAKSLIELIKNTLIDKFALRIVAPSQQREPYYVFMLFPHYHGLSEEQYRTMRREVLFRYCFVTRFKFQDAQDIIGFATEPGIDSHGSEDLVYYNARGWSDEHNREAESISNEFGLLKTIRRFGAKEFEFPTEMHHKRKRRRSKKKKS
jgi:hypothetical protein